MADEEEMEDAFKADSSEYEIPGVPGQSSSLNAVTSMESSKTFKISASLPATETVKTEAASGPSVKRESQTSGPSGQNGSRDQVPLDEASRSKEGLRKSQELQLNGKKPSLDQLGADKPQQSPKTRPARLHRQCQRRFREIIGKRELKNEELERQEGDLRQRLNILECSMPAVMVWNIWRMTQGGSVPSLQRVLEKQFQGPASGEVYCPSTPSRHFDCRVREVEAERKQAQKRVEEARTLWVEKMSAMEEREKKLEEAKKVQEEQKERIQQLTVEAQKLREAASTAEDDGSCETGECGVIECKKKWLEKVPSSASIKSTDLECLEKLQQLAETELSMKRQIADLERREEAYMRTLQQADEMWLKVEGDAASTTSALQEQLDMKTAANQQMADHICQLEDDLEKLRARLAACRSELEKFMSIEKIEALIGRDDDFAEVTDQAAAAGVKVKHRMIGREDDFADVDDKHGLVKEEMAEKDVLARPDLAEVGIKVEPIVSDVTAGVDEEDEMFKKEMAEKDSLARPDLAEAGLEAHPDVADLTTGVDRADLIPVEHAKLDIHPEDFDYEERRLNEAREYLARLGSLSALDADDDYVCPPDFACNDLVFSETGMIEEELAALREKRVTAKMLLEGQALPGETEVERTAEVPVKMEGRGEVMMRSAKYDEPVRDAVPQVLPEAGSKEEVEIRTHAEDAPSVEHHKEADIAEEGRVIEHSVEEARPVERVDVVEDIIPTEVEPLDLKEDLTEPVFDQEVGKEDIITSEIETESSVSEPDKNNILVSKDKMLRWQVDIDSIRVTIAKCPECLVVKKDADKLAEMIAQYTDTEVKEVVEEYVPREKEVELEREMAPEKPTEIEEAEVTAAEVLSPEVRRTEVAEDASDVIEKETPLAAEEVVATTPAIELAEMEEKEVRPVIMDETSAVEAERAEETVEGIDEKMPDVEKLPEEVKEILVEQIEEAADDVLPAVVTEVSEDVREPERPPVVGGEVDEVAVEAKELPVVEETEVKEERVAGEVEGTEAEEIVEADVTEEVSPVEKEDLKVVEEAVPVEGEVEVEVTVLPPKEDQVEVAEEVPVKEEVEVEVEVLPVEEEKVPEAEEVAVEVPEKEEIEIEIEVPSKEEEEDELPKEEVREVEVTVTEEIPPPGEGEVEVEVEVLPEKEEEIGIEEISVAEEVELEVEIDVEDEEIIEVPEEEEVEVEVEALTEEEKVEVEVEVFPKKEEVEVKVEALPEEDKVEVEVEVLPEEDKVEVEVEVLQEKEEVEVEVEALPEKDKVEVEVEVLPEEEKVVVEVEVLPEKEEVEVEMEALPEEEEVEVEMEALPEEEKVEVEVKVLPEEEEKLEDVVPTEEEIIEVPTEEVPPDLEEEVTTIPIMEIPEMPTPEEPGVPIPEIPVLITLPIVEDFISCMCRPDTPAEPPKKIEVTQTEVTQMEIIKTSTIQVVTQTVGDVGTQTLPSHRIVKRVHQPKFITITRTVDPEPEVLERLTRWRKPQKEPSIMTTTTIGSQTEKSSFLRILQSLRTEASHPKHDPEQELRSINYGRRSDESEQAECNCCMCGKMVSSSMLGPRTPAEGQPSPIMGILSALPIFSKLGSPGVDQAVQHETFCPECKLRRFQEALRTQDPSRQQKKATRKPTRDQQVDACSSSCCRRPLLQVTKQKIDQSCMVKISRLRIERTLRKDFMVDQVNVERGAQEKVTVPKEEDKDSVECICSETVETGEPGVAKKVRCACGDPD